MSLLVADCPRCGSKQMTFDVTAQVHAHTRYGWQNWFEIFCICRGCLHPTIFLVSLRNIQRAESLNQAQGIVNYDGTLNRYFEIERFISVRDNVPTKPPEHLPDSIKNVFIEGAACLAIECYNAAAIMFRLCVDLATEPLLPAGDAETRPNRDERRKLGLRLKWLFNNGLLPPDLRALADCIKEEGDDGAHVGGLSKVEAEDLLDFTEALLDRLITEPKKLELAEERRQDRRKGS